MTSQKAFIGAAGALALLCTLATPALAQDASQFPNKDLRLIVPYPPGASTDAISRAVADEAKKVLHQSVIVENRPGAGTAIGTRAAKGLPADGYTLMFQASGLISNLHTMKEPGYALKDFTPVTMLAKTAYTMLIPASIPAKNIKEFVAYAKANPGKMRYGTLGRGSRMHVMSDQLARDGGFEWTQVPYKGTAEAAQAVMQGDVQAYFSTQAFASQQSANDKLRIIGITSDERSAFLPDVPTFKESGFPNVADQTWYALFVRSETPQPIVDKLRTALAGVMKTDAIATQLKNNGLSPNNDKLADFPANAARESARLQEENKRLGIEAE